MRTRTKAIFWIGAVVVVVLGVTALLRTQSDRVAAALCDLAIRQFGRERNVRIGAADIGGSLVRDVRIKDLRIIYTGGGDPRVLLVAPEVYVRYGLLSFFTGTVRIDSIHVTSPRLVVPVGPDGRRIFPQGDPVAGGGDGRDLVVRALSASDLTVVWEAGQPWIVKGTRLEGTYAKNGEVSTVEVAGEGLAYGRAARVDHASVSLRSFTDRVEVSEAVFRTPGSAFRLAGVFGTGQNDSVAAELQLDSLAVAEIPALCGLAAGEQTGRIVGSVRAEGRYTDLRLRAALAGRVEALEVDGLEAAGAYSGNQLLIDHLACLLNGSPVEASGTVRFSTPPAYSAAATFAGLDVSRLAGGEVMPSDLSGRVTVRGRGLVREDLEATVWSALGAGRYGDRPFDTVVGRVDLTPQRARLDSVVARIAGTEALASGAVDYSGDADLAFELDCPDLGDLAAYHRLPGLGGELTGQARLTVRKSEVGFSGKSLGRGIDYGGAYLESLLVEVNLDQPGGRWTGRGDLLATSLNLRGFKAGRMVSEVAVQDSTVSIERLAITRPDGDLLGASGKIRIRKRGFLARIDDLFVEVAEYVWRNREPIVVVYGGDSLTVSTFVLSSEMGALSMSNSSFARDRYTLEAEVSGLDLGRVRQAVGKDIPTGTLGLKLKAGGGPEDLRLDLDFDVRNGEIRSVGFSSLGGSLSYQDKTLALEDIVLSQNGGTVEVEGRLPIDLSPRRLAEVSRAGRPEDVVQDLGEISLRAVGMDISIFRPLAPPLARVGGIAELDLAIGGPKDNPRVTSRGTLRQAVLGRTAVGDVTWDLALEDSLLRVASLAIAKDRAKVLVTGDLPVALSVMPFSTNLPHGPMDLAVKAENGDLGLLCEIVPRLKVCTGTYGADLKIGGPVDDPTFDGRVSLAGARLRLEGIAQGVEDIHLAAEADGKRFVITNATAEGGALRANGYLDLEGVKLSGYEFAAAMKHLAVTEFEDFYVVLGGDVTVRGEPVEYVGVVPKIEGAVIIEEGEYYYSTEQVGGGGGAMGPEAAPSWLMNVGVEIPHHFWIRGKDIDAELQGSLNVKRGSEGLRVLGSLRTVRGTFSIYNNDFRITRGEFRFTDVKSIGNVYIDLEATSRVLDERVDITAKGSMENLDVMATSESGWSETQIFEALTLRRGSQTEGEAGGKFFTDEFLRSWGVALVNRFGNDVARELRLDQFGVEIGDVGEGDVLSATRVTFGKYVSDKVYLQYTQSLGSIYGGSGRLSQRGLTYPERQFQVEYRLSDRFSMEGEAGTVGGLGYFDVDLKFTLGY